MNTVSCVMATYAQCKDDRIKLFRRSFECYCRQSYRDTELVIVAAGCEDYVTEIRKCVADNCRNDVRIHAVPAGAPLGMLRGIAIDQADGDFICQWDDDDLYHPTRIERQVEAMLKADARASYLADYLHLFQDAKKVFLCDWKCGLPGTLLAYKEGLPIFDDSLSVDEDTDLQRRLIRAGISVAVVRGLGLLYVYTFHGGNSFSHAHHLRTALSTARNATEVLSTVPALCCALRDHRLEPPLSIVDNRGKIIFEWSATVDSSVE